MPFKYIKKVRLAKISYQSLGNFYITKEIIINLIIDIILKLIKRNRYQRYYQYLYERKKYNKYKNHNFAKLEISEN